MWEILVPTISNDGIPFKTKYHRIWDEKVKAISGGLTILTPTKGKWVSPCGTEFHERMIPVRIICSREEIEQIIDITMKFYNQEAILAYKISDEVILKHREKTKCDECRFQVTGPMPLGHPCIFCKNYSMFAPKIVRTQSEFGKSLTKDRNG